MFGKLKKFGKIIILENRGEIPLIVLFAVSIIVSPILTSWLNTYLQTIFNITLSTDNKLIIMRMLLVGFIIWMLKRISDFSSGLFKTRLLCNINYTFRQKMFSAIFKKDLRELLDFSEENEYISRFTNDLNVLEQRLLVNIIEIPTNIISIVILCFAFYKLNHLLALIAFLFCIPSFVFSRLLSKYSNEKTVKYLSKVEKMTKKLKEYLSAFRMIRNYNACDTVIASYKKTNYNSNEARFQSEYSLMLINNITDLVVWFMQFVVVGIGLTMVVEGRILLGTVISSYAFSNNIANPMKSLMHNLNSIQSGELLFEKIENDIYNSKDMLTDKSDSMADSEKCPTKGCIEYKNVSLLIDEKKIIDDFSFRFEHGKKYLIIGPNGAGKSTIAKMVKKQYIPTSGELLINGIEIERLSETAINNIISYVPEKISIITDTVKNNVFLCNEANENDLLCSMNSIGLDLDINRIISENDDNISSGEKRKIDLLRNLVRNIPTIIFDEVLSSLDIETSYNIEKMILELSDVTIIMISHIFSKELLKKYDNILIIQNGRLIANGNYETLIKENEYFKKISKIKFENID